MEIKVHHERIMVLFFQYTNKISISKIYIMLLHTILYIPKSATYINT